VLVSGLLGLAALLLWSLAVRWRFPAALPQELGLASWKHVATHMGPPLGNSLLLAGVAAAVALALTLACLEHESRTGPRPAHRVLALLYLPLAVPQLSFLPGLQGALVRVGLDGTLAAVAWTHVVFVFPYVMLVLREPYLSLHPAYAGTARVLGRGEAAAFWRVKLPLLRRPIGLAAAIGATVSLALYLPTLFAGAGRIPTLVTETLALAGGGDRRLAAAVGLLLALLPLLVLAAASSVPAPARVTAGVQRGLARAGAD
jgi:putative thiamine transport system permease protein